MCRTAPRHGIVPPFFLYRLARDTKTRDRAFQTLERKAELRLLRRESLRNPQGVARLFAGGVALASSVSTDGGLVRPGFHARVYTMAGRDPVPNNLPGRLVRDENAVLADPSAPNGAADPAVEEAFLASQKVHQFFSAAFGRKSIDDRHGPLESCVHYGFQEAFWDGSRVVLGDGDGVAFDRFTKSLDAIGHEFGHGVIQYSAKLNYYGQPGALNEHFADVFGALAKQYHTAVDDGNGGTRRQKADEADWLIGKELLLNPDADPKLRALRDMENPGTAFTGDEQPNHLRHYVVTQDDDGGVHFNSGIPNRAFVIAAKEVGGFAWESVGRVWYDSLVYMLRENATFQDCANATATTALQYGDPVRKAVEKGWKAVGITAEVLR